MMEHNFDFDRGSGKNPFGVPEGYFDDFCKRMETMTTPKRISLLQRVKPYRYAAAVIAVAVITGAFLLNNYNDSQKLQTQHSRTVATSEYNDVINKILIEDTNDDMIVDYIIAEVD
ncbi:hypothetical protein HW49_06605 [Porphyromonadaceae bacterium COT-184 OH4590]|nr:hypothetical protein HW49_06605 [Porphyromonadaceae bacterium COT-184 OH4590]